MGKLWQEFKAFAFKGNMIDLAVGIVIGSAFGKVVESLVKNIIMPLVSLIIPAQQSYQNWSFGLADKQVPYGQFIAEFVNFVLIAFAVFIFVVKLIGWLTTAKKEVPPPPALTKDQELLSEIRDLLRGRAPDRGATPTAQP